MGKKKGGKKKAKMTEEELAAQEAHNKKARFVPCPVPHNMQPH